MQRQMVSGPLEQRYNRENDQHISAIDKLVHELGIPAEEVNRTYREILDELKSDMSARAFLPILVSMNVKKRLTGAC